MIPARDRYSSWPFSVGVHSTMNTHYLAGNWSPRLERVTRNGTYAKDQIECALVIKHMCIVRPCVPKSSDKCMLSRSCSIGFMQPTLTTVISATMTFQNQCSLC